MDTLYTVKLGHELQTLLTIMARRVQQILARTRLHVVGRIDEDFAELDGAIDSAFEIARELLAIGKPHGDDPAITDVNEVLAQSARGLERLAGPRITLSLNLQAKESLVQADIVDLEWLLFNLVANARDAMPAGGTITILTDDIARPATGGQIVAQGHIRISVKDTGHAIASTVLQTVFEPFTTTRSGHVGLGLTSVGVTVRRLKGRLVVESQTLVGTTGHAYLPVVGSFAARRLITSREEIADPDSTRGPD